MTRRDFLQGLLAGTAAVTVNLSQDRAREQANENNHAQHRARELARRFFEDCPETAWVAWFDGVRSYRAERHGKGWRLLEHVDGLVVVRHTCHGGTP